MASLGKSNPPTHTFSLSLSFFRTHTYKIKKKTPNLEKKPLSLPSLHFISPQHLNKAQAKVEKSLNKTREANRFCGITNRLVRTEVEGEAEAEGKAEAEGEAEAEPECPGH